MSADVHVPEKCPSLCFSECVPKWKDPACVSHPGPSLTGSHLNWSAWDGDLEGSELLGGAYPVSQCPLSEQV